MTSRIITAILFLTIVLDLASAQQPFVGAGLGLTAAVNGVTVSVQGGAEHLFDSAFGIRAALDATFAPSGPPMLDLALSGLASFELPGVGLYLGGGPSALLVPVPGSPSVIGFGGHLLAGVTFPLSSQLELFAEAQPALVVLQPQQGTTLSQGVLLLPVIRAGVNFGF